MPLIAQSLFLLQKSHPAYLNRETATPTLLFQITPIFHITLMAAKSTGSIFSISGSTPNCHPNNALKHMDSQEALGLVDAF